MRTARRGPLTLLLLIGVAVLAGGWVRLGETEVTAGSSYVEAVLGRPVRINPLAPRTVEAEGDLAALIFGGLMRLRPDGMPEPELAERWEVTPDGLTYTFHLRAGITWHDGVTFDAHDVAFTVGRIQSDTFDGPPALAAAWQGVEVFVADPRTVLIHLPEPSADFLERATLGILPAHLEERMTAAAGFAAPPFDREPVGTGPYRLEALADDRAVLMRNTSYALGTPGIERLVLRFATDAAGQARLLREGAVDAALLPEGVDSTLVDDIAAEGRVLTSLPRNAYTVLYLNEQDPLLRDAALRRALVASVDVEEVVRASGSSGAVGEGLIPPGSWAHPEATADAAGDGEGVQALWDATDWQLAGGRRQRDGQALTIELLTNGEPLRLAMAESVAEQLGEHGVGVEIAPVPAQRVVSEHLQPGDYQAAIFGWEASPDPDPYAGWHTSQIGAGNVAQFSDRQADTLLEAARTTLDVNERRNLFALFLERFEELGAGLVLEYPQRVYAHPADLGGFEPRLLIRPSSRFEDVHLWRRR